MAKCPKCQNELETIEEDTKIGGVYGTLEYQRCSTCGWDNRAMLLKRAQSGNYD